MKIKERIKYDAGFQYLIDNLQLCSSIGRTLLLDQDWCADSATLNAEWDHLQQAIVLIENSSNAKSIADLRHCFMELHDIRGTLDNLQHHRLLSEVELFEVKCLAHISLRTSQTIKNLGIDAILPLPDLTETFSLLDPDNTHICNFYIYDSYHPQLAPLRKELRTLQNALTDNPDQPELQQRINDLFTQQESIQQQVILRLSERLWAQYDPLNKAFRLLSYGDLIFAKAIQASELHLCRPTICDSTISYRQLFNPRLKQHNESLQLRYQPVDVAISQGLTLITGANMAGKTVLLKTLATAQSLAQYGFYVPATEANITLVEDILWSIGDEQDEMNGLSSFASEITKISLLLQQSQNHRLLLLIDEPARTTNPVEGKAIVQSIGTLLHPRNSFSVITTHYSQLGIAGNRLRVKGFVETLSNQPVSAQNINQFIDYSLVPDSGDEVPQEALRIAKLLGCDSQMITEAQSRLNS